MSSTLVVADAFESWLPVTSGGAEAAGAYSFAPCSRRSPPESSGESARSTVKYTGASTRLDVSFLCEAKRRKSDGRGFPSTDLVFLYRRMGFLVVESAS